MRRKWKTLSCFYWVSSVRDFTVVSATYCKPIAEHLKHFPRRLIELSLATAEAHCLHLSPTEYGEQNFPFRFERKVLLAVYFYSHLSLCYLRLPYVIFPTIALPCSRLCFISWSLFFSSTVLKMRYSDRENILLIEHGAAWSFSSSYLPILFLFVDWCLLF